MSFILDALKKSEAERKRQDTPGIASIPESRAAKRSPRWTWVIAALLLVNFAVLVGLMLEPDKTPPATSAATPPEVKPGASDVAPAAASFSEIVREAKRSVPEVRNTEIETAPSQAATSPSAETTARVPPAAPAVAATSMPRVEALSTFDQLRAEGLLQLPDLHLDIHVYSTTPADRFVFVNMSKYKEGGTLAEGPTVREIAPDGVILEYRGRRFLLPRE